VQSERYVEFIRKILQASQSRVLHLALRPRVKPRRRRQQCSPDSYQAIFDTNVLGVLLCMKYEIRAMLPQGKGSIVNISSAYGKVGGPTAAVYVGSKHAVEGITKSAAIELAGTGVRVNIVGPGPVETRMFNHFAQTKENKESFLEARIPNKRIGTPEEIANAIVFIASEKASYIIGASLAVDGGMIAG
jgi:NAD(P)-dependent dehydrogenase (short-subunit alcohol dehydrogenase family)